MARECKLEEKITMVFKAFTNKNVVYSIPACRYVPEAAFIAIIAASRFGSHSSSFAHLENEKLALSMQNSTTSVRIDGALL